MSGDRAFADDFLQALHDGREVVDYARLFQRAGVVLRKRNAGKAWIGNLRGVADNPTRIGNQQAPGTPAYDAGLEQDDQITELDGKAVTSMQHVGARSLRPHKPGDAIAVTYKRRSGVVQTATITLKEDPAVEAVTGRGERRHAHRRSEGLPRRVAGIEAALGALSGPFESSCRPSCGASPAA